MPQWPKQNERAMNAFYGDPDRDNDGQPDSSWVSSNVIKIIPPYPLYYPKEVVDPRTKKRTIIKRATQFKHLYFHKKAADSLIAVLNNIKKGIPPDAIIRHELDICGGTFVFRLKRNGSSLSIHSWASAIDLSHLMNGFGVTWKRSSVWGDRSPRNANMMPQEVVKMFRAEGWTWGGLWSTPDAMHFQVADL